MCWRYPWLWIILCIYHRSQIISVLLLLIFVLYKESDYSDYTYWCVWSDRLWARGTGPVSVGLKYTTTTVGSTTNFDFVAWNARLSLSPRLNVMVVRRLFPFGKTSRFSNPCFHFMSTPSMKLNLNELSWDTVFQVDPWIYGQRLGRFLFPCLCLILVGSASRRGLEAMHVSLSAVLL